jgi:hypothetical protein
MPLLVPAIAIALALTAAGATGGGAQPPAAPTVVLAVGDGADGRRPSRGLAAYIRAQDPDRFFYLGDVYERGTATEFRRRYDEQYGALADVTDPVIGNHEFRNRGRGYYPYWRRARGWTKERARHRAYVDSGSGWQVIAYSSEHSATTETRWVARQLAKHDGTCRIVIAHRGRHVAADGLHGDNRRQEPVWRRLRGRTAINLVAHNHLYARLAPLRGVHVIVSGAGGHEMRRLGRQHHRLVASKTGVPTVTRLELSRGTAELTQLDGDGAVHDAATIGCDPA